MIAESYPLFDQPAKVNSEAKVAAVLELLRAGPKTTDELEAVVVRRAAASVRILRQRGYEIKTEKLNGIALYTLLNEGNFIDVTGDMKDSYYTTDHWRAKRLERLRFDNFKCCDCRATDNLHVHHWKYDLFTEDINDLLTLCEGCHDRIHSYPNVRCHFPRSVPPEIAERLTVGFRAAS